MALDRRETKGGEIRWRARYRAPDGRERSKTFDRKADAQRWLTTQGADAVRGDWVDPTLGRMRFDEWAAEWLRGVTHLRPTSLARTEITLRKYLVPRFGPMPLSSITVSDVKAMIADQLVDGLAPGTVRKHGAILSTVLAEAVRSERIARNPLDNVKLPAEAPRPMRCLDADQVHALAATFPEHYRSLVYTAAFVGPRWGELAGLRIDRLDLLRRRMTIDQQMVEVRGAPMQYGPPKTKSGVRMVSIPGVIADMLAEHCQRPVCRESGLVFPTVRGRPMRRPNFSRVWKPRVAELFGGTDLEGLVFHELRHTAASLAIAHGAHPLTIKERLGHSSITTTMNVYGHMFPGQDEALADALDGTLRSAMQGAPAEPSGRLLSLPGSGSR